MYLKQLQETREQSIKAKNQALREFDKSTKNTEKDIRED